MSKGGRKERPEAIMPKKGKNQYGPSHQQPWQEYGAIRETNATYTQGVDDIQEESMIAPIEKATRNYQNTEG